MKGQLLSSLFALMLASNVFANDENDKYFIAYNVSQTSKLPDVLKKQMQSAAMLDQIAVETLKKIGQTQLAAAYYNRPDLQNKLRPLVQNFITSKAGGELFDDASTQLFSSIYSVDELKALYQNNKSAEGQKFVNSSMSVDLSTQEFINNAYKQKFDKVSIEQLDADIQKIYTKYSLNQDSLSIKETPTQTVGEKVIPKVQPQANESTAVVTSVTEQIKAETVGSTSTATVAKENKVQVKSPVNEIKQLENTAVLNPVTDQKKAETLVTLNSTSVQKNMHISENSSQYSSDNETKAEADQPSIAVEESKVINSSPHNEIDHNH